jgi:hypothetical protein
MELIFGLIVIALIVTPMILQEQNYKKKIAKKHEAIEKREHNALTRKQNLSNYKEFDKLHSGYCIYHICKSTKDTQEGYIGVSSNFTARKSEHLEHLYLGCHINYKLQKAYDNKEFDESNFYILKSGLSKESAYDEEYFLRKYHNVGWNIKKGGQRVRQYH